jgi:hypothetical protein
MNIKKLNYLGNYTPGLAVVIFRSWRFVPPFAFGDPSLRSGTGSTKRQLRIIGGISRSPP